MYSFRLGAAFSGANETYLRGITEISRVTTGGRSYLLTNSGPGGGVMALQLTGASSGHGLRLADQMALAKSYRSGPDAGLEMVSIDGQLRVTTMGPTVSSVSATALSSTGALDGNLTLRGLPANRADLCFVEHSSGCFASRSAQIPPISPPIAPPAPASSAPLAGSPCRRAILPGPMICALS